MSANNMKIKTQLILGFGIIIVLATLLGATSWTYYQELSKRSQHFYENNLKTVYLSTAQNALWQLRYGFPQFMVLGPDDKAKIVADESKWYKIIDDAMEKYGNVTFGPGEEEALSEF